MDARKLGYYGGPASPCDVAFRCGLSNEMRVNGCRPLWMACRESACCLTTAAAAAVLRGSGARTLGIGQRFTRPYRSRTNAKNERLIRTPIAEWVYDRAYVRSGWRTRTLLHYPLRQRDRASARRTRRSHPRAETRPLPTSNVLGMSPRPTLRSSCRTAMFGAFRASGA